MNKPVKIVHSHFELPTYQRRLRHLRCLALRNLCWPGHKGKDLANLQSYFTLHTDRNSAAFYTSEKVQGSLNPTWQSFDISRYEDKISTRTRFLVLKIWVGIKNKFDLLIDWEVNLMGLLFFADKLQDTVKYATNSLIFGMFDKYFVAPEESLLQKSEIIGDVKMNIDSAAVRNAYRATSLSRIYTVLRATKQTQATVNRYHRCIEDKLLSSQEKAHKLSSREALIMKRTQMRSELTWQLSRLQSAKDDLDKMKNVNQIKEEEINGRFLQLKKSREELLDSKKSYNQTRENFIKGEAQWKIRRKQLIGELATYVYPITENDKEECFICNVKLPNSENFQGCDDTQIAVALGYTGHMVSMMSHILDFPLRYPIENRSSRTQITDHIHHKLTEKDNTFPLYSKRKEKFYFNYGVYLLNKDIGQLRFYCGMGTKDLRITLQNIKTLLELRLGTKLENQNRLRKPNSDIKDKSCSDIDTHSSLASGGRFSAPGSADMSAFGNILSETNANSFRGDIDNLSNNSSLNSNNRKHVEDIDSEDISFQPSQDDNFFKISNPVSDRSDILYDVEAIEGNVKVTELLDFSEMGLNQSEFSRTDSFNFKLRTDSDLTTNSSEYKSGPKTLVLESQISILSTTDYHQKHSNLRQLQSTHTTEKHSSDKSQAVQSNVIESTQTNIPESTRDNKSQISEKTVTQNSSSQYKDITNDPKPHQSEFNVQSESLKTENGNDENLQNDIQEDISSQNCDGYMPVDSTFTEESFPEIPRTFKTLSFRQTVSKPEGDSDLSKNNLDGL